MAALPYAVPAPFHGVRFPAAPVPLPPEAVPPLAAVPQSEVPVLLQPEAVLPQPEAVLPPGAVLQPAAVPLLPTVVQGAHHPEVRLRPTVVPEVLLPGRHHLLPEVLTAVVVPARPLMEAVVPVPLPEVEVPVPLPEAADKT